MGVFDDVLCNNDLFGTHKGETHYIKSLNPLFPGSAYEITPAGRLELLECPYEDHSDQNAQRCDTGLHGWVEFLGFGRAKFTDGTMVAFEPALEPSDLEETTGTPSAQSPDLEAPIYMQSEALGALRVIGQTAEAICLVCRHFMTDDQGSRNVLQRFWTHQVFVHDVPPDVIGVEGLENISTPGIQLGVQIVVRSRPRS